MSPSVAVSIMRYAANNGTSAARAKYGPVVYNDALGIAKSKDATGEMVRKSLQNIAKKSSDSAKNIPKAVRDMMVPRGSSPTPKKPGADIPEPVRRMMISPEQDARNQGDARLRTEQRGARSATRGVQRPAPSGVAGAIRETTDSASNRIAQAGSRLARLVRGVAGGAGAALTAEEVGRGSDYVPPSRRDEFVKAKDAERRSTEKARGRGRGDGSAEVKARKENNKSQASKSKNYNVGVSKGGVSFNEAFRHFRSKGQKTFTWNGKKYTTELKKKEK